LTTIGRPSSPETAWSTYHRLCPSIAALPYQVRMNALIEGWERHRSVVAEAVHARPHHRLADVRLRAPVPRPGKLVCAQLSFREGVPDAVVSPTFFLKSPDSVIGPDDVVELSAVDAAVFHHEAELAVVIGRRAKAVSASEAMKHVFGYTCFLDCSARGVGPGTSFQDKSYDTFGPMGPWITTAGEIPDPHALHVKLWVDGALRHDYPMSDLAAPVAMMIAAASSISTLEPGDVLALGVNHQGLGPIQDGETLRIAIEQVGEFKVSVPIRSSAAGSKGLITVRQHGCATTSRRYRGSVHRNGRGASITDRFEDSHGSRGLSRSWRGHRSGGGLLRHGRPPLELRRVANNRAAALLPHCCVTAYAQARRRPS
jgi:2-keto-4-pentenoate hydratase/2-oxohepta-3-ene-1,7-dioic acid hydratase in catechol pathway